MPLHLNSITNDSQNSEILAWMLQEGMDKCDSIFITEDQKYFHIRCKIEDRLTGDAIGKIVYTLLHGDKAIEVLDLDIVLDNDRASVINFLEMRDGSSDSNEYYEAEVADGGQHFELETVNRHVIAENLIDTEREVYISAFPFALSVYEDMDAFDAWAGFKKDISVGDTGLKVGGFSEKFMMPGGMTNPNKRSDESYSFVVGRVVSFKDVEVAFGKNVLPFVLAWVDSALGVIPVPMGRDVFDLKNLKVGCIIAMNADIKVDVAKEDDFKYPKP